MSKKKLTREEIFSFCLSMSRTVNRRLAKKGVSGVCHETEVRYTNYAIAAMDIRHLMRRSR